MGQSLGMAFDEEVNVDPIFFVMNLSRSEAVDVVSNEHETDDPEMQRLKVPEGRLKKVSGN